MCQLTFTKGSVGESAAVYQVRRHERPPAALCFLSLHGDFREVSQDHTEGGGGLWSLKLIVSQSGVLSWQMRRLIAHIERNIAALLASRGRAEAKTAGRSCEIRSSSCSTLAAPVDAAQEQRWRDPCAAPQRPHAFISEVTQEIHPSSDPNPTFRVDGWCGATCALVLPVQCEGVVELDVWVSHGVEGGELLQRLHQLHDGLVILNAQGETSP